METFLLKSILSVSPKPMRHILMLHSDLGCHVPLHELRNTCPYLPRLRRGFLGSVRYPRAGLGSIYLPRFVEQDLRENDPSLTCWAEQPNFQEITQCSGLWRDIKEVKGKVLLSVSSRECVAVTAGVSDLGLGQGEPRRTESLLVSCSGHLHTWAPLFTALPLCPHHFPALTL